MNGSVNKVILVGRLTRDPEIRHTQDGAPIVNLNVATSERWTDRQTKEKKEKSEFHRVVIFNESLAKVAEQYLRKGSQVYIEGQLQTRKWTDQNGVDKYSTEIVLQRYRGELTMLGGRGDATGGTRSGSGGNLGGFGGNSGGFGGGGNHQPEPDLDDDIPF